jgi:adenine-specific DNA-methyltransferase
VESLISGNENPQETRQQGDGVRERGNNARVGRQVAAFETVPELSAAVEQARLEATNQLNPERKIELGQFMTPACVARFMADLFSPGNCPIRLLDAGAGVGSLTDAFINRWGNDRLAVSAYEVDESLAAFLRKTLSRYESRSFTSTIIERDFIQDAVYRIKLGPNAPGFTHAILNPPYKKINSNSVHRALLRAVGLETVNLYTAFLGLAIELMAPGGEIVAIIPRSFCNGLYYRPFREWMLEKAALQHVHLFHSRTSAFTDDAVLQENVIIKLTCGRKQGKVMITTASDASFSDLQSHSYAFDEIVNAEDDQKFIHVPTTPSHIGISGVPLAHKTLPEIGLEVSTGPVVDFRLKEFLRETPEKATAPLLYPTHFVNGVMEWPRASKKPNALMNNSDTRKWLYPKGFYTIVRRFSSKEERRRIVAHVVDPKAFNSDVIGFENHLNVFHSRKKGIGRDVAHGLSVFLNSTAIDDYFRRFSGHTQVNATDLRLLKYPALGELEELGRWVQTQERLTQEIIDRHLEVLHGKAKQDH